jgi:hypothetical protein
VLLEGAPCGLLGISGTQALSKDSGGGGVAGLTTRLNAEGDGDLVESEENTSDLGSESAAYQIIGGGQ